VQQQPDDAESLRRRLSRTGASAADLQSYLATVGPADAEARVAGADAPQERPAPEAAPESSAGGPDPRGRRRRALVGLGAGAGVIVLLAGGAFGVGRLGPAPAPSTPAPAVSSFFITDPSRDPGDTLVRVGGAHDRGTMRGAKGAAAAAGTGRYWYTMSGGDTVEGIARRFEVCTADVVGALPYGAAPSALPAGQVILVRKASAAPPTYDASGIC
jgi:nucleoid-associated protein YgaU